MPPKYNSGIHVVITCLMIIHPVVNNDGGQIAILPCLCNQSSDRNGQIRIGHDLDKISSKLLICCETICLGSVAVEDHFYETFILNMQIVDCRGLLRSEGAEGSGGESRHVGVLWLT